jgi:Transposase DDE domain
MSHRLQTPEGKKLYALRKQIPEPVFGIIKSAMGFRQFLLRGLENVQGEWTLVTMAWNMKRMLALAVASGAWPFLLARKRPRDLQTTMIVLVTMIRNAVSCTHQNRTLIRQAASGNACRQAAWPDDAKFRAVGGRPLWCALGIQVGR